MPFMRVTVPSNVSAQSNAALAKDLTNFSVTTLQKPREMTTVTFVRVEPSEYFIGGEAVEPGPGIHLEVSLTTGTNSADERKQFIKEVSESIVRIYGPNATLRGVALTEYLPESYGYEGITQYERSHR